MPAIRVVSTRRRQTGARGARARGPASRVSGSGPDSALAHEHRHLPGAQRGLKRADAVTPSVLSARGSLVRTMV